MNIKKSKRTPNELSNPIAKKTVLIVSVLIGAACLIAGAIVIPKLVRPKPTTAKIMGAAWITKGSGDSSVQRGLEISLCSPDTSKSVIDQCCDYAQEEFKEKWKREDSNYMRESAERKVQELQARGVNVSVEQFMEKIQQTNPELSHPKLSKYTALHLSQGLIEEYVRNHSSKSAKTDVDGKFIMDGIKPGQYALFSSYDNNVSTGYWLLPVTLKAGDELKVNFDNANLTASYDESDRASGEN